jgi:hypothetical protein
LEATVMEAPAIGAPLGSVTCPETGVGAAVCAAV